MLCLVIMSNYSIDCNSQIVLESSLTHSLLRLKSGGPDSKEATRSGQGIVILGSLSR